MSAMLILLHLCWYPCSLLLEKMLHVSGLHMARNDTPYPGSSHVLSGVKPNLVLGVLLFFPLSSFPFFFRFPPWALARLISS